jgi:hypothetical protein
MSITPEKSTRTRTTRVVIAWLVGSVGAYFLTSFFSNFHSLPWQFIFLGLLFQWLCGIAAFIFVNEILQKSQSERQGDPLAALPLLIAFALSVSAAVLVWQFPGLFDRRILFMDSSRLPLFALLSLISLGPLIVLVQTLDRRGFFERLKQTRFFKFVQENLPGLWLALFFLMTYLIFAETINFPGFRTLDQFFDTDISEWLTRLTAATLQDASIVRPVHPAVMIFLRLPVWFLSLFLNGDRLQAVFLMNALAGAGCVMLMWLLVKRTSGNTTYALIMASILGVSFSHLLLSSMLETYIYSALALLFFTFLIQSERTALKFTVPAGVLVFGITVTNLIQTCILYFFNYPRIKVIIKYILIVVLITAALNLLQVAIYPNAHSIFQPANYAREGYYLWNPFDLSWRTIGRFSLIARAIPLYGVVSPTPFILKEELAVEFPNFRTYQILLGEFHVAGYRGLADVTVKFWIIILAAAGILFIFKFFRSPKQVTFPLSLVICLGFSFGLHLVYGDDPMLYSPNWVYALILFVALMLQRWADRRWLQLLLMGFLVMLMNTNLSLIYQIMEVSAPYFGK